MSKRQSLFNMGTMSGFSLIFAACCVVYWSVQDYKKQHFSLIMNNISNTTTTITSTTSTTTFTPTEITFNPFDIIPQPVYLMMIGGLILIIVGAASTLIELPSIHTAVHYAKRPVDFHKNDPGFQVFKHRGEVLSNIHGLE